MSLIIFLSYDKVLFRLNIQSVTTKGDKILTYKDLIKAVTVMQRKHKNCRWKNNKNGKSYILIEGYYWIRDVYFNKAKSLIDADIVFFESRINVNVIL